MGSFGISKGNITGREKKTPHTQIIQPSTTPGREVAQMLASASSELGMNREAWAACLGVTTGFECIEDNLRELT